jgi:hypothetical protein
MSYAYEESFPNGKLLGGNHVNLFNRYRCTCPTF